MVGYQGYIFGGLLVGLGLCMCCFTPEHPERKQLYARAVYVVEQRSEDPKLCCNNGLSHSIFYLSTEGLLPPPPRRYRAGRRPLLTSAPVPAPAASLVFLLAQSRLQYRSNEQLDCRSSAATKHIADSSLSRRTPATRRISRMTSSRKEYHCTSA